ncbi:MAG TPA: NHL repeat-containing protein [Bacillota bacterium]|nr:NHL repeat-containing protein [Bacillota bacterium]
MIEPRKLRSIILVTLALGLILTGVFSLIQPADDISEGPIVPVVPAPPVVPDEGEQPVPLPVVSIIQGLKNEEIGMPYRVAVWRDTIYVVDALAVNGVIKVLDEDGNLLRHFGSLGYEGLSFVVDMAVDSLGNVVVLDTAPSIHVFSTEGEHLQKISIDSEFAWSKSVQVARDEFYVVSLSRLFRMSQAGEILEVWPSEAQDYQFGTAASEFYLGPSGLAATPRGIWVSDSVNSRLLLLSYTGELMEEIMIAPAEDGSAAYPTSLAVDVAGSLHVVDAANLRILRFSAQGELQWEERLAPRTDGSHPEEIYDIAMLQYGKLLISDSWTRHVEIWEVTAQGISSRRQLDQPSPSFVFPIDVVATDQQIFILSEDAGLGGTAEYAVYQQSGASGEVSLFTTSFDGASLRSPTRLAVHGDRLYVLELDRVLIYSMDGTELGVLGDDPTDWGGFAVSHLMGEPMGPQSLVISDFGEVYVADTFGKRLLVFHTDGEFIRQLPLQDNVYPVALTFSHDGAHLFILNSFEGKVIKTDAAGATVLTFASPGQGEGQLGVVADLGLFDGPRDIGTDSLGNVYVLDTYNARVVKFSSEGVPLGTKGNFGGKPGEFYMPSGMFIDSQKGYMYIADTYNHRIQVVVVPC